MFILYYYLTYKDTLFSLIIKKKYKIQTDLGTRFTADCAA